MDIPWKIGLLVFTGVPAIIGGGILYHFFGSYIPVAVYEIILYTVALGIVRN